MKKFVGVIRLEDLVGLREHGFTHIALPFDRNGRASGGSLAYSSAEAGRKATRLRKIHNVTMRRKGE